MSGQKILPEPENPWPENTVAGRAWLRGRNDWLAWTAPHMVNQVHEHADEISRLRARVAELEAQVAALSAEPTVEEVDVSAVAIDPLLWSDDPHVAQRHSSPYRVDYLKDKARSTAKAALTAFLRRRSQP